MGAIDRPYRCRYNKARQYSTHQYMGHTLLTQLLSSDAMLAISSDKALFHTMVEYLSGHKNPDNVIEQIVTQADAASVTQDLGADKEGIYNYKNHKSKNRVGTFRKVMSLIGTSASFSKVAIGKSHKEFTS